MTFSFRGILVAFCLTGCGGWGSDKNENEPEVIARFDSLEDGELRLTGRFSSAEECAIDPGSGIVRASFISGHQKLSVILRELPEGGSSFECRQAATNFEDRRYIGDGFEDCAIEIEATDSSSQLATNLTYGLYRRDTKLGLFAATSGCNLQMERRENFMDGHFECQALVQTAINGNFRNPVADENLQPKSTKGISGAFRCNLAYQKQGANPESVQVPPSSALPPIVGTGSVIVNGTSQSLVYRSATSCKVDPVSGSLQVDLNRGEDLVSISIRDFDRSLGIIQCEQTENNTASTTSLGDLYEGCSVRILQAPTNSTKQNGYAMFRHDLKIKPFKHNGSCKIDVLAVDHFFKARIDCLGMAQTHLNGIPRNPVASRDLIPDLTANLKLDIDCALEN